MGDREGANLSKIEFTKHPLEETGDHREPISQK